MDSHNVKVNSMDRAAYQMLVPEYQQMKNILELLDSTKEEEMGKWGTRLEEDIKIFHESVTGMKTASQDERLLEDVEFIDPILSIVEGLKADVTELENKAKANAKFQVRESFTERNPHTSEPAVVKKKSCYKWFQGGWGFPPCQQV